MSGTSGIVISGMKYKESSKILTVYTEELGKVRVMAQGALRPKSQTLASTEVFALSSWNLKKGRSFFYVESIDLIDSCYTVRDSMERMFFGFYVLELLDKSTPDEEPNQVLFSLLKKFLEILRSEDNPLALLVAYEIKFATFIGYRPHLDSCVSCGRKNSDIWEFDRTKGGILCDSCSRSMRDRIYNREINHMKSLLMAKLEDVRKVDISEQDLWSIHNRLSEYLLYNLDIRELKSLSMIKQGLI
ncbi:MAG: DNA repair protein RecO [Bacillota bacterium]